MSRQSELLTFGLFMAPPERMTSLLAAAELAEYHILHSDFGLDGAFCVSKCFLGVAEEIRK